jgi:hypothetical protein
MSGALLGALMVLTMGGRAEASCSGCSTNQYCQYGHLYDSCALCPGGCADCGSQTRPVHGTPKCPPPPPPPCKLSCQNATATGSSSTALGYNTMASGEYSTAMGDGSVASGAVLSSTPRTHNHSAFLPGNDRVMTRASIRQRSGCQQIDCPQYLQGRGRDRALSLITTAEPYGTAMGHHTTASGFAATAFG